MFLPPPAKAEEPKAEAVSGNDITAPPSKELPPSPEKKPKVGTVPCLHLLSVASICFSASSAVPAPFLFSEQAHPVWSRQLCFPGNKFDNFIQ